MRKFMTAFDATAWPGLAAIAYSFAGAPALEEDYMSILKPLLKLCWMSRSREVVAKEEAADAAEEATLRSD